MQTSALALVTHAAPAAAPAPPRREALRRERDDEPAGPHACPECGARLAHDFGRVAVHERAPRQPQAALRVGAADDRLEREADAVADRVMRTPDGAATAACDTCARDDDGTIRRQTESPYSVDDGAVAVQAKAAADGPAAPTPAAVRAIAAVRGGSPLPASVRNFMETRFGHDFGRVRVHTGGAADAAARSLHARAYTLGRDVVFGAGQFAADSATGRRLIAHELAHVIQQGHAPRANVDRVLASSGRPLEPLLRQDMGQRSGRDFSRVRVHTGATAERSAREVGAGSGPVVQRDVVDEVREKLSYGLFDWAITDTEAIDSLALLGTLPPADLPSALSRLGTKFVSRLLDNLPDAAKSGEIYQRVITALGSAGTMDYATGQLSLGLFDWAVTDAEVARVFNLFTTLPAAERESFLVRLDKAGKLGRLLGNASFGHYTMHIVPWMKSLTKGRLSPEQRSIMRTIVRKAPTSPIDILQLATELRYDVTIGPTTIPGRTPVPWDGRKLRDTYLALDYLPEAHVARNKELVRFGQFSQPERNLADGSTAITAGVYNQSKQELASNVKKKGDIAPTMIHETGHAVDAEMGWSTGPEPAKPERGGWKEYPDHNTCATDMVDDSNGGIKTKLAAPQRTDVIDDMATAMGNRSAAALATDIRARPWFKGLAAGTRSDVLDDKALKAIPIGLQTPWFTAEDGGEHLGDHVYQESYTPTWVRYRHEARSRKVEKYQFRDSGEWFAECYAAYYDPGNKVKGQRLNKADPSTKTYFDSHVDTRAPTR